MKFDRFGSAMDIIIAVTATTTRTSIRVKPASISDMGRGQAWEDESPLR